MATVVRHEARNLGRKVVQGIYLLLIAGLLLGAISLSHEWIKPAQVPSWLMQPGSLVAGASNGVELLCDTLTDGPSGVIQGACGEVPALDSRPDERCWANKADAWCVNASLLDAVVFWAGLAILIGILWHIRQPNAAKEKLTEDPWSKVIQHSIYLAVGAYSGFTALKHSGQVQALDGSDCWESKTMCFHDLSLVLPMTLASTVVGTLALVELGMWAYRWRAELFTLKRGYGP